MNNKNIAQVIIDKKLTQPIVDWLDTGDNLVNLCPGEHQPAVEYRHMRHPQGRCNWSSSFIELYGHVNGFPLKEYLEIKDQIIEMFNIDVKHMIKTELMFGDMLSVSKGRYMCHFHQDPNLDIEWIHTRLNVLLSRPEVGGYQSVYDSPHDCYPLEQSPREYVVDVNQPWMMVAGMFPHGTTTMTSIATPVNRTILSYGTYIHRDHLNERGWATEEQLRFNSSKLMRVGYEPTTILHEESYEMAEDAIRVGGKRLGVTEDKINQYIETRESIYFKL